MRVSLTAAAAITALAAPLALAAPAQAAPICSVNSAAKFKKVLDVQPGGVRAVSKKKPYGGLTGRWTKVVVPEYAAEYHKPYGKKHTYSFAKNAAICVLYTSPQGRVAMRKTDLKGLRKAVDKPKMNPQWGLRFNSKGKITVAYQIFHP